MTVKQLIKKLSAFPQDMQVKIYAEYDAGFGWAGDDVDKLEKRKDPFFKDEVVAIVSLEKSL